MPPCAARSVLWAIWAAEAARWDGTRDPGRGGALALTCSWRWAAGVSGAESRRGTAPRRPGPAAPAPSTRVRGALAASGASCLARRARGPRWSDRGCAVGRVAGPDRGFGRARARPAGALQARRRWRFSGDPHPAPGRVPPPPLRLLARTSPFAALRARLAWSLNDAPVPPGPSPPCISLPSRKRDSASIHRKLAGSGSRTRCGGLRGCRGAPLTPLPRRHL